MKELELMPQKMKDFKLDPKAMKELELLPEKMKGMKEFKLDPKTMKELELMPGKMKVYSTDPKALEKMRALELKTPMFKMQSGDIMKLIDSLNMQQRDKQEKQGYLTLDDLTPEQRKMLGDMPKGQNWTIAYVIDGKKLTLKSK